MEPGAEPEPSRRRERSLTAKRSLLAEYDRADYKARHALLSREQLTVRQISRWRSELRVAARKKAAAQRSRVAAPDAKKVASAKASEVKTAPRRTKAAVAKPAASANGTGTPAARLRAAAGPARESTGGSRPRRAGVRSQAAMEDDVAAVHVEALVFHTAALDRLLENRAHAGAAAPVLTRLLGAAREANEAARLFLELASKPAPARPARSDNGRTRRPWWGAKGAPPPPPPAASGGRPKRWGR